MIGPVPLHSFFMNRQLPRFIHMQEGIDFILRDAFLHSLQLAMPPLYTCIWWIYGNAT